MGSGGEDTDMTIKEMVQALYDKEIGGVSTETCIYLGTTSPVDVTQYYENYDSLTEGNFIIGVTNYTSSMSAADVTTSRNFSANSAVTKSYDSETGILTFSAPSASNGDTKASITLNASGVFAFLRVVN